MTHHMLAALSLLFTSPALSATEPVAVFDHVSYRGSDATDSVFPIRPGTFRNPILPGFHPDPSIVRVGADYYLVNSSFAFYPGLPVFHSRDMVHWKQIGNAVDRPDLFDFAGLGIARGLFAPTLRYHGGVFYIVNACVDCGGSFMITATNPAGPWSAPRFLPAIDGIDTDLFFDDDGRVWIANNGPPVGPPRYEGHRAIWLQELDLRTMTMTGPRTVLVDGGVQPKDQPIWAEGPHIIKRDGWYYLIAAEGGTAGNHSQTVYRSRAVTGTYAPGPVNPILTQRDLDPARLHPVQATGHADFVQRADGTWWSVFLATRPYEANLSNLGRETFLLPVSWPKDGWPVILPAKMPVPLVVARPSAALGQRLDRSRWHEDFAGSVLSPEWLMLRTPKLHWFRIAGHSLEMRPQSASIAGTGNPAFLARRQEHGRVDFVVRLRFTPQRVGDRAGVVLFADERHYYFCGRAWIGGAPRLVVSRRNGGDDPEEGVPLAALPTTGRGSVRIRVRVRDGLLSFDSAAEGRSFSPLLENTDGRILASEPTNLFTGTVIGLYAQRGP